MAKTIKVLTKSLGNVTLTDSEYLAGGGEGEVYVKGDVAFKIYHDSSKMLHISKIHELQALSSIPEIIIPKEILYNTSGSEIGYIMKYVKDREFLCKLFTKGFRTKNNISEGDIANKVVTMQRILNEIHSKRIIVGDYNEMNFVLDSTLKTVFHIDTDSWQTPSFKCTAIMPTVQDLTVPMGYFDENTDWYSWAVVVFQLYTGIHPYKGRHPDYQAKDFERRVRNRVSVFNKDVEVPATAQDFTVIPKPHLDWFKEVFEKGHRGVPPQLGTVNLAFTSVARVIKSSEAFVIEDYFTTNTYPRLIFNFKENLYIMCKDLLIDFQTNKEYVHKNIVGLCEVLNKDPIVVLKDNNILTFAMLDGTVVGTIEYDKGFFLNGACYTTVNGTLIENTFKEYRKIQHVTRPCDTLNPMSYMTFDGMIVNNIVGKNYFIIPYAIGYSAAIRIPDLDNFKIIDAKYINKVAVVMAESKGKYFRFIFNFDEKHEKYDVQVEDDVELHDVNFTVLPNGITMNVFGDERIELFQRISSQVKQITSPPIDSTNTLYHHLGKVIYVAGNKIKKITMKKP